MNKHILEVERHPLGRATFRYTDSAGNHHAYSGAWDDTTPWESGTFTLNYRHRKGDPLNQSFQIPESGVPERIAIQVHYGSDSTYSEGCLVTDQKLLDLIYKDLNAPPFGPQDQPEAPLKLKVTGDFPARLQLSTDMPLVEKDGTLTMQAGIALNDQPYTFSKDVHVRIGTINTATSAHDYEPVPVEQEETPLDVEPGGWVKIPAGQSFTPFHVPIGAGTEKIEIVDYRIHNPERLTPHRPPRDYIDNRGVLLEGATHSVTLAEPTEADWCTRFKAYRGDPKSYLQVIQEAREQNVPNGSKQLHSR